MKSKDRKAEEKKRQEILAELPSFVNNLLLLLGSGMVLQEAMEKIYSDYGDISGEKRTVFQEIYLEEIRSAKNSGLNIINGFEKFAYKAHVKELSRVSKIISDGQKKGFDISDKLGQESKELWEIRKQIALQRIGLAESKMSFPLALILLALILMTAAPAMLQMYID